MQNVEIPACAYCGRTEEELGYRPSVHSGVFECGACWNWRKLDGPASTAWSKLTHEFFKTVDMYDLTTFFPKSCGLTSDETNELFRLLRKLEVGSDHGLALAYKRIAEYQR